MRKSSSEIGPTLPESQAIDESRLGLITSFTIISIVLAGAVAVLIPRLRDLLPRIQGLNYGVVQVGLVLVVCVFSLYTFERERQLRRLTKELVGRRIESETMASRLSFLKEVQTERDTVSALLLSSADGVLVVDEERKFNRMNPRLSELTGWREPDADGHTCEDIFGCRRDGALACGTCPFEEAFQTKSRIPERSIEARRRDGNSFWLSGGFAPVPDANGGIGFGIATVRDVTKAKEVEQLQHDFVSIVSHELRGPLTAIKGFVKTLIRKSGSIPADTQVEFLQTIDEQSDRLNQLVEDLLNVSRIESKRLKMSFGDVDLEALARKLVGQFSAKWGDREITMDIDPGLPLVWADQSKIDEVFINLIDNAVKYSPAGGPVKITMSRLEDYVEVAVEDSGIGIAPEDAAKLFERFNRIATPETRDIGGTGLGLYIVKNLVEAHGGQIFVTSAPKVGSTFTFTLPIQGPREVPQR